MLPNCVLPGFVPGQLVIILTTYCWWL